MTVASLNLLQNIIRGLQSFSNISTINPPVWATSSFLIIICRIDFMWSIYHNFYYYPKTIISNCNSPNLQQQHKQPHHLGRNKYNITTRSVSTFKEQNYCKLVCVHMCACTVDMYFSAHLWNLLLLNLANDWSGKHQISQKK